MKRTLSQFLAVLGTVVLANAAAPDASVRVSPRDSRYLELSDGRPYVPIGLNLIHPDTRDRDGLERMEQWLGRLAANGGNFARVWLSSPFWDPEQTQSGRYDEAKAERLAALLEMAGRHGIRLKLTLEHFREMSETPRQRWANKPLHLVANGGPATNAADFFAGSASRAQFKHKLEWFARHCGGHPAIFGWELWNEVNAVAAGPADYLPWTEVMLAELHRLFPRNLAMQSLGSFDSAGVRDLYRRHSLLPGNDLAQVHRYLDLGARLPVCHQAVDVLTADAVRELLAFAPHKPVLLAESGAVEPGHSGPFKLYARDTNGIILHDVLFAPFFAGAAGAGQIWHWDVYVDRNRLWHHFGRFAEVVKDLDPAGEHFEPVLLPHPRLRVYALKGRQTLLVWCRDVQNTWQSELEQGTPPETLDHLKLDLASLTGGVEPGEVRCYDPWQARWERVSAEGNAVVLPTFVRSIVLRALPRARPGNP
jgi:hypothetical protein